MNNPAVSRITVLLRLDTTTVGIVPITSATSPGNCSRIRSACPGESSDRQNQKNRNNIFCISNVMYQHCCPLFAPSILADSYLPIDRCDIRRNIQNTAKAKSFPDICDRINCRERRCLISASSGSAAQTLQKGNCLISPPRSIKEITMPI